MEQQEVENSPRSIYSQLPNSKYLVSYYEAENLSFKAEAFTEEVIARDVTRAITKLIIRLKEAGKIESKRDIRIREVKVLP